MKKVTKPDYSIARVWILCQSCGHNYPSNGTAQICEYCGFDEWEHLRGRTGSVSIEISENLPVLLSKPIDA